MIMSYTMAIIFTICYYKSNCTQPELLIAASIFWFSGRLGDIDNGKNS